MSSILTGSTIVSVLVERVSGYRWVATRSAQILFGVLNNRVRQYAKSVVCDIDHMTLAEIRIKSDKPEAVWSSSSKDDANANRLLANLGR